MQWMSVRGLQFRRDWMLVDPEGNKCQFALFNFVTIELGRLTGVQLALKCNKCQFDIVDFAMNGCWLIGNAINVSSQYSISQ